MALDGAFLYTIKQELMPLIGGRVDKIYQPSREEIIISLRANSGNKKIHLSANASSARVHITKTEVDNPKAPPMFCMLMRKHLSNGRLLDIRQDGLERILYFDFEAMNEIGDMVRVMVACEIMGRCSNIILINKDSKIIDSIKRVDEEMSRERLVLPGMTYTYPPRGERLNILTATKDDIVEAINSQKNAELSKVLIKTFEGICPLFAREAAFYASKNEITKDEIDEKIMDRLLYYFKNIQTNLLTGHNTFTVLLDKNKNLKDFCFTDIHQYGGLMFTKEFETATETLDYFYLERDNVNRMKQRSHDLLKFLVNTSDRISRKLALQKEELITCADRDRLKVMGDLISSNMYSIQKGVSKVTLQNYYSEDCENVEVKMDPRLSPSQNAQHYYSEYRKAATAEKKLVELIKQNESELQYIDSVFDALTRSSSENDVLELKYELAEGGYIKANRLKQKPPKIQPPMEFYSSDGYKILVGRNNKQNDKLTLKTADNSDIWLHTKNIPGSHVIILTGGENPPQNTIDEAAVIAAFHSKAKSSSQVPVDYTLVKYVKKPQGSKPGMVIFTNNKTLYVTPDGDLVAHLKTKL